MKQVFLLCLTKYAYICQTHFCDQFKITLKIARAKSWLFSVYEIYTKIYLNVSWNKL